MGETRESCSTTVAGIFKRPSPALSDMYVCLTIMETEQLLGLLGQERVGGHHNLRCGAGPSPFPLGPSKPDKISCRCNARGKCAMDSQQMAVIKRDDRFYRHSRPTQMSRPLGSFPGSSCPEQVLFSWTPRQLKYNNRKKERKKNPNTPKQKTKLLLLLPEAYWIRTSNHLIA